MPSDATLERALRDAVRRVFNSGDLEELTVRRIRRIVENDLGLEEDFFKNDDSSSSSKKKQNWKERSKDVISEEVDAQEQQNVSSQPNPTKESPAPASAKKSVKKTSPQGVKRDSEGPIAPRKRRKKEVQDDVSDSGDHQPDVRESPAPSLSTGARPNSHDASGPAPSDTKNELPQDSDSEMSVLIDEEPKRKGKGKKSNSAESRKPKKKAKKGSDQPADPQQEEIKRLQGWLVKCGIRKMWYKELAPYPTSKDKIRHLKQMLTNAGMSGRYSQERANQIREERELKADLEAVQEGAKQWGRSDPDHEEGTDDGRPKRRLAKGLQELDFLNDDDGEETD